MESVNKSGKRRRGRCKKLVKHANKPVSRRTPAGGHMLPAGAEQRPQDKDQDQDLDLNQDLDLSVNSQGLPALHMACLYGQLATVRHLVASAAEEVNCSDPQGRRPIHAVMTSLSSPNTSACLRYLLENGADVSTTTDLGQTPLHLAASEGLLDCTEILVEAGADVLARDSMGHTPLDVARIWCHRKMARYLKSCMWKAEKKKEMEQRKLARALYSDLVDTAKVNNLNKRTLTDDKMAEWENKKGFPHRKDFSPRVLVSQYHSKCLSTDRNSSNPKDAKSPRKPKAWSPQEDQTKIKITSSKPPPASTSRPWAVYMGQQPEKPPAEPDLRGSVTLRRDGPSRKPQYTTVWDASPRVAPDLPLDALQRVLFPRAFPSRIVSPHHFEPRDIVEVQHRGCPQGQSTSPWTEVAMHLAEVLEPGHF